MSGYRRDGLKGRGSQIDRERWVRMLGKASSSCSNLLCEQGRFPSGLSLNSGREREGVQEVKQVAVGKWKACAA
jgi:hypothetical protein